MIYKEPTIYKNGEIDIAPDFVNANKIYPITFLSKYSSYIGNNSTTITYNELLGFVYIQGFINITSSFTPVYSSSDPGGGDVNWPCVAEIQIDNILKDISAQLIFGDLIRSTPYVNEFRVRLKKNSSKAFIYMSSNKQINGNNWYQLYSTTLF